MAMFAAASAIEAGFARAERAGAVSQAQQGAAPAQSGKPAGQSEVEAPPWDPRMMNATGVIFLDAYDSFFVVHEQATYRTRAEETSVYRASRRCSIERAGVDGANLYLVTSCGEAAPYSNYLFNFNRRQIIVIPYTREGGRMTFGRAREYRAELCSVGGGVFRDGKLIVLDECGGYSMLTVWDSEKASPRTQFIEPGERVTTTGGTAALLALLDGGVAVLAFVQHPCGQRLVVQAYSPELQLAMGATLR